MQGPLLMIVALLLGADSLQQGAPVPVLGDRGSLVGTWEGTYHSRTGRTGAILFRFEPGADSAHGAVFIMPGRSVRISFVWCGGDEVTGRLETYKDLVTGEEVFTMFEGRLLGNELKGSYSTLYPDRGLLLEGSWSARWKKQTTPALGAALWALGPTASQAQEEMPFLLSRLALDLTVDYEQRTIVGTATLTLRNSTDHPAGAIPLLLNRLMTVSAARRAGGPDLPFAQRVSVFRDDPSRQVNAITVELASAVPAHDSITVEIRFGGILVGYTETGSLYIRDRVDRAFTIIREDAYAFPVLGVLSQRANRAAPRAPFGFSAKVTVPSGQVVAMGGEAVEPLRQDSLVTWSYHGTEPVPFLNIAIAPYRVLENPGARIFYFPADTAGAGTVGRAITRAVARYTAWFGPLTREPRLVVMEIPDGFGSQASLAAGILQTAAAFRDSSELRQLYHELSHVWNPRDIERPSPRWNEGLASFLEYRMAAELDGWTNWDGLLDWYVTSLKRGCGSPAAGCDSIPMAAYGRAGMTDRSYSVGALMFYILYQVLGPETFDRAYRDFFQQHQNAGALTADLTAAFRRASPRSEAILQDWLLTPRWYGRLSAGESLGQIVESYRR